MSSTGTDRDTLPLEPEEEGRRAEPVGAQPSPRGRRVRWGWIVVTALVLALVAGAAAFRDFVTSLNPFGETEQVDRTGPAVLLAITDLSEYRAATGQYQVIVDLEEDAEFLPAFLRGERTLFVASGSVDASVDFSGLGEDAVEVSEDRLAVVVRLPNATLSEATVDPEDSYVFDRRRGLLDRLASVFSDEPTSERELYLLAERRLEAAAAESELTATAERNTRQMLESLLGSLGFTDVTVTFG